MADDADAGTLFSLHALKVIYIACVRMQPLRSVLWPSQVNSELQVLSPASLSCLKAGVGRFSGGLKVYEAVLSDSKPEMVGSSLGTAVGQEARSPPHRAFGQEARSPPHRAGSNGPPEELLPSELILPVLNQNATPSAQLFVVKRWQLQSAVLRQVSRYVCDAWSAPVSIWCFLGCRVPKQLTRWAKPMCRSQMPLRAVKKRLTRTLPHCLGQRARRT